MKYQELGAYRIFFCDINPRAELISGVNREYPRKISWAKSEETFSVDASNVASDGLILIPEYVIEALKRKR